MDKGDRVVKFTIYLTLAACLIFPFVAALAQEGPGCDHPNFYVKGCDYPDLNGTDGIDGRDGKDGVIPPELFDSQSDLMMAASVIDFTVPVNELNRASIAVGGSGKYRAMGMTYSRRFGTNSNSLLSIGFGSAGLERVGKVQLGWEF